MEEGNDPFLIYSVNSSTKIFTAHICLQNLFFFPYFHRFCILTSSIQPLPLLLQSHHFTSCLTQFSHECFQPFFTKHTLLKYKLHTNSASHHFLWILILLRLQEIWSISSLLWFTVLIPVHCRESHEYLTRFAIIHPSRSARPKYHTRTLEHPTIWRTPISVLF